MNFKQYLEQHHGWTPKAVSAKTHAVTYFFQRGAERLEMECLPNGKTVLIWGSQKVTIPDREEIGAAFGRKATEQDLLRVFDQVLERLEEAQKPEDRREIEGAFKRHARQKM